MAWIIAIAAAMIISYFVSSTVGKIMLAAGVVAVGLLLLSLITGFAFLITLAKVCAAIIVIASVTGTLIALFTY